MLSGPTWGWLWGLGICVCGLGICVWGLGFGDLGIWGFGGLGVGGLGLGGWGVNKAILTNSQIGCLGGLKGLWEGGLGAKGWRKEFLGSDSFWSVRACLKNS